MTDNNCWFCEQEGESFNAMKTRITESIGNNINCKKGIMIQNAHESSDIIATLDSHPFVRGHTIIVPIGHSNHMDLWNRKYNEHTLSKLLDIVSEITNRMMHNLVPAPRTIHIASLCESTNHFHIHLIPRYPEDWRLSLEENTFWRYINRFYKSDNNPQRREGFWYMAFHELRKNQHPWVDIPQGQEKKWFEETAECINQPARDD